MAAIPAVLLMGPTAAGKSALALALAERLGGEIVSVDSAQVYRGLDVGTAKPDAATRARIPHHLIDILDPTEAYSAARFAHEALAAIADIRKRGRRPIVAGGTMLYFRALSEGLSALPAANSKLRAEIDARAARESWPALHAELARVDPPTAARLQPTDAQRIQRALEVWRLAGVPLSALQGRRAGAAAALGATLRVALVPSDRKRLHEAIARRFDAMLAAGLVDEVKELRRALRSASRAAVDALRRLPPGVGVPGGTNRRGDSAQPRHRGNPTARQAPVHLAARKRSHCLRPLRGGHVRARSCRGGVRMR